MLHAVLNPFKQTALVLGRVIKSRRGRGLERLEREVLPKGEAIGAAGSIDLDAEALAERLLQESQGACIHTMCIERTGATMRGMIAAQVSRRRVLARMPQTLERSMYLGGGVYNVSSASGRLAVALIVVGA